MVHKLQEEMNSDFDLDEWLFIADFCRSRGISPMKNQNFERAKLEYYKSKDELPRKYKEFHDNEMWIYLYYRGKNSGLMFTNVKYQLSLLERKYLSDKNFVNYLKFNKHIDKNISIETTKELWDLLMDEKTVFYNEDLNRAFLGNKWNTLRSGDLYRVGTYVVSVIDDKYELHEGIEYNYVIICVKNRKKEVYYKLSAYRDSEYQKTMFSEIEVVQIPDKFKS